MRKTIVLAMLFVLMLGGTVLATEMDKSEYLNFFGKLPEDVISEYGDPDSIEDHSDGLVLTYNDYGVMFVKQKEALNPDVINCITITEGALFGIVIGESYVDKIPEDFSVEGEEQFALIRGHIFGCDVMFFAENTIVQNIIVYNPTFIASEPQVRKKITEGQLTTIAKDIVSFFSLFSEQTLSLNASEAELFAEYLITYNTIEDIIDNYISILDNLVPYEQTIIKGDKIDARYVEALGEAIFGADINSSKKEYQILLGDLGSCGIVLKELNQVNGQYQAKFGMYDEIGELFLMLELHLTLTDDGNTRIEYVSTKNVVVPEGDLYTYDQLYAETGLMGCIDYFDSNYDFFTSEERNKFAGKISFEINNRGNEYAVISCISAAYIPAPRTIEYVNSLYPDIYDGKTNTLSLGTLENNVKEIIKKVNKDEVFKVVKSYYIMEDVFEDSGFAVAIHPEVYKKIERALDITFVKVSDFGAPSYATKEGARVEGLEYIMRPREVVTVSDSSWNSDETYPEVLVESVDKLKLLEGAWKTCVYVPVIVKEESQNTDSNHVGLSGFAAEKINGTYVNYADYSAVIVPMYDGVNKSKLTPYTTSVGANQFTDVTFAVFGQVGSLKIFHTNNGMSEEYTITRVGDIENSFVIIKTMFPTDFAHVMIRGFVKTATGDYQAIEFTLDDMRDLSEYQPIMIK